MCQMAELVRRGAEYSEALVDCKAQGVSYLSGRLDTFLGALPSPSPASDTYFNSFAPTSRNTRSKRRSTTSSLA
jgi:hypothetical protein